jgi:hypothetical protein
VHCYGLQRGVQGVARQVRGERRTDVLATKSDHTNFHCWNKR